MGTIGAPSRAEIARSVVAADRAEGGCGEIVGVAEHSVGHRAESAVQPEVLGMLVAKREDELGGVVADVLDGVQRAAVDDEHLPAVTGEAREHAAVAEHGDQRAAGHTVAELVARWRANAESAPPGD